MITSLTDGPLLWFLNRGTGVTLLVVLTLSLSLGMLAAGRRAGGPVPAFVPRSLHRNLSMIGLALVVLHAVTAVVDSYVDIRWWQALSPLGATYEPLWLGLGTLSFDLMLLVGLTTWARSRLRPSTWHRVHLLGYACWPIALIHSAGIGTDAGEAWARWLAAGCTALVLAALATRVIRRTKPARVLVPVRGS